MLFVVFIIIIAVVIYVRRMNKQNLLEQWQQAAARLHGFRSVAGGTVIGGYPSLIGMVEGHRIDVAPFVHNEYGNTTSKMTGFRVRVDSPILLPQTAITRLTNHFARFEVEKRRIFCASQGVETSASNLVMGVELIRAALREAHAEADRAAEEMLAESREKIAAQAQSKVKEDSMSFDVAPPPLEQEPVLEATLADVPVEISIDEVPAESNEPPAPAVAASTSSETPPAETSETIAVPDSAELQSTPAEKDDASLIHAAQDLFDAGRNRFQITQRFDAEYASREVTSRGVLRRIETFANDRTFGRGPGVVAEIEVYRPSPKDDVSDDDEMPSAPATGAVTVSRVTANVELLASDDSSPSTRARAWRERIGEPVELCGTLVRCDAFDARLFLKDGILA